MTDAPFGPVANAVLHNLCLGHGANLFEELLELAGPETGGQLLDKNSAPVALIPGRGGIAGSALPGATAFIIAAAVAAVVALALAFATIVSGRAVAVRGAGARAATAGAVAPAVVVSVGSMTT